jgi:cobalt-zinc-cadmium efflux system membrane fusion protein
MDVHEDLLQQSTETKDHDRPARRLNRKSQWAIIGTASVIVVGALVIGLPGMPNRFSVKPTEKISEPATDAGDGKSFKLTDRQWATLKLTPVETRIFQDAAETDGKIAVDDDLVTPVYSPNTGRVTKLIARAGDTVALGDPLFTIQAGELAQAQNDLISAAAALRTAKAQLQLSTTSEKRQHDLYLAQGAALKDWQQAQVDLATAQGGMNSAQIALGAVRNRLRILGKSDSDIDAIEAATDIMRLNAETVVNAPIAGTVVQRQIGLGQNIVSASSGASNPVFLIGDLSKVWLIANVRESDAPLLHKGDPVEVVVLAWPKKVFRAHLTYVASSIDSNTHRLPVRAEVDNPNGELKPEMFATFRIVTGEDAAAPAAPREAVVYEGTAAHVWAARPADKSLEVRPIEPGRSRDGMIEVLSGLHQGEQIVTSGAVFIDRAASND